MRHDQTLYGGGGGGVGLDFAGRLWLGRLVGAGNLMAVGLIGSSELVISGGLGLRFDSAYWRLIPTLEVGAHTVSGLGSDLLRTSTGGSSTLPCGIARLSLIKRRVPGKMVALGFSLFLLTDHGTQELDVSTSGFGGASNKRYRTGGTMGGTTFHFTFGS